MFVGTFYILAGLLDPSQDLFCGGLPDLCFLKRVIQV